MRLPWPVPISYFWRLAGAPASEDPSASLAIADGAGIHSGRGFS